MVYFHLKLGHLNSHSREIIINDKFATEHMNQNIGSSMSDNESYSWLGKFRVVGLSCLVGWFRLSYQELSIIYFLHITTKNIYFKTFNQVKF